MGMLGRYIDGLPAHARDRVIEAQDWCVAAVHGAQGSRCLVGHAEDWRGMAEDGDWWTRWVQADARHHATRPETELEVLCRPELFAFRRERPADMRAYRARLRRWGADSEARIGARFDRLCARRGMPAAIHTVKRRAGRAFALPLEPRPAEIAAHCQGT